MIRIIKTIGIIKTILIIMITNQETTMIDMKKKITEIIKIIINIIDKKCKIPIHLGILFLGNKFGKTKFSLLS
jgi:hypothetical protein